MGEVYRAYDQRLERPVAIKQLLPEMETDDRARRRLRREARAVASLNHPSIVQVFDIVEEKQGDWIVMELVEGETLQRLIEQQQVDLPKAVEWSREVAEGLAEAHAKGIVHRDLKTENVMVNLAGHAKILDFGLAKQVLKGTKITDGSLSIEGTILGTGRSMSPEQAMGDSVDHRSDLFSLGTLLYEAAVGEAPFKGASIFHTLARICTEAHRSVLDVNPALPHALSELIDRLLEKDPDKRPATALEVAQALEDIAYRLETPEGKAEPSRVGPMPMPEVGREESRISVLPESLRGLEASAGRPLPPPTLFRGAESSTGISIKTLLWVSVADHLGVSTLYGETRSYEIFGRHDRLVRDLLARFDGLEIEKGEGFLILFVRPIDAIFYALGYHQGLVGLAERLQIDISARAGIHLGEVFVREHPEEEVVRGVEPFEVEGEAKRITTALAAMARGGQTLITQATYDLARRAFERAQAAGEPLRFESYGFQVLHGVAEAVEIGEVGVEGEAPFVDPSATVASLEEGGTTPRRGRFGAALVVLLLLLVGGLAVGFQWRNNDSEVVASRPGLVVLGFKNFSGDPELDWLGTALAEMVNTELSAGEGLRPVPGESVSRMRRDLQLSVIETLSPETLKMVREMVDAHYLVLGSYSGGSPGAPIHLTMQVQQTTDGGTKILQVEAPDLFALVTEAGGELRRLLKLEALSAGEEQAVRASMGATEEAARLYAEGLEHLRSFDAVAAHADLERAVASDGNFALAHAALSDVYQLMGYESEAEASARRASELGENLTRDQQLWVEARYHEVAGNWSEAIKTWQALWEFWPDQLEYGLRLARAQTTAGRGQEAMSTLQELRSLPSPAGDDPRIDLEEAKTADSMLAWRQQVEAATRARQKGLELNATSLVAEAELLRGGALYQRNDLAEAERSLGEARRLFEASGDEVKEAQVKAYIANLRQTTGQVVEARKLFKEALVIHKKVGNRKGQAEVENSLAFLVLGAGDFATAEEGVLRALEIAREIGARQDEAQYLDTLTWILLGQSRLEEAKASAEELLRLHDESGSASGKGWGRFYQGQAALALGELDAAQRAHEEALMLAERAENEYMAGFALDGLATLALARDDLDVAERHATDPRVTFSDVLAWIHFARGDVEMARTTARSVATFHRSQGNLISEAGADLTLAAVHYEAGEGTKAQKILEQWRETIAQKPTLRLRAELLEILLEAPKIDADVSLGRVEEIRRRAAVMGLRGIQLEARLVAGRLESSAGRTAGEAHLAQLAEDAKIAGYHLLARKARAGGSF